MLSLVFLLACTPKLDGTPDTGPSQTTGVIDSQDTAASDSGDSAVLCERYRDEDGDGWGDADQVTTDCDLSGYVDVAGDCDDQDVAIHPDAIETCNTFDDDCDSVVDEGDVAPATWFQDLDLVGYGTTSATQDSCEQPEGFAKSDDDCNDADATVHPYAHETCDGVDQDCDAAVDEEALDATTWHADLDADGFGDAAAPTVSCEAPSSHVEDATDCDDTEATVHPGAAETCDDRDEDCDSAVDEDAVDPATWYTDEDLDGYGDPGRTAEACDAPSGTVEDASDCDDGEASVHPGAEETCDGVDQDCDGTVDEDATDFETFYADGDSDGYGDAGSATAACEAPSGHVADDTDCDDGAATVFPGAPETCDGADEDCDGSVDEDPTDPDTFYADTDSDGYGDAGTSTEACSLPSGHVADHTDCDDGTASVHPGASETCDGEDEDCDGTVDEDPTDPTTFYADSDSDGYGDPATTTAACSLPSGHVSDATDCDDGDSGVYPGALESCDDVDQDCDGTVDESAIDVTLYYADTDGDGYGDASNTTRACELPSNHATTGTDCDDGDSGVFPGAGETCDGVDQDCDGTVDEDASDATHWYTDSDGDGYGDPASTTLSCSDPGGASTASTDCDDGDATVHPGATEVCDSVDQDCDTLIDEGFTTDWYDDDDGDGYGDPSTGVSSCSAPSSAHVSNGDDCYDSNADAFPGQTSFFDADRGDGHYDYDCDGTEEQEEPDFSSCDYDSDGECSGNDGWYEYYGWADIPDCGDGWYWEYSCEEEEWYGWEWCDLVDYDYRYQHCR